MKAVLLVGHGSRNETANQQFEHFAKMVGQRCKAVHFHYAFLELAAPSINDEIHVCVEKGVKELIVFPLLLLAAGHAKVDIPKELAKIKRVYPNLTIRLEQPLGEQEILLSILEMRLLEHHYEQDSNHLVVVVGRGSHDEEAIMALKRIAERLSAKLSTEEVNSCFLVGGDVSFEEAMNNALASNYERIFVLPYLLFNGILLKRMTNYINSLNDERLCISRPIGVDEKLVSLVTHLLDEAL